MPKLIADSDMIYIRATPIPRALESVQQTFTGFYPKDTRTADFPPPNIVTRAPANETLFPNDGMCRRFSIISRAFAQRTANRWNDSMDMSYLTKRIGKWMPEKEVAVDSRPRLSGIMDTVNATRSHDGIKQLPREFYEPKVLKILERIAAEEWFQGYEESREYRMLGIGGLVGDIVERMVGVAENKGVSENKDKLGDGEKRIKFALSGCHDTTLGGTLASLGAYDGRTWPPFTSHLAVELFRNTSKSANENVPATSWWSSILGSKQREIGRRPLDELTPDQRESLDGYYVRLRYNDEVVKIPGCKARGKHLQGDDSFCTLVYHKSIFRTTLTNNRKRSKVS
jgi:acid phosphatase